MKMPFNRGVKVKQHCDKRLPLIACRTATFCRPESLNEAVESFLRQDYPGPKQMVILNDVPSMQYESRHPEVIIENAPARFPTLGDKMNHLISGIDADIVVNWPDDDIVLPNALSTIVKHMGDREVFAGRGYWYMESGVIKEYVFRHCAGVLAYRREVWDRVGGYASIDNGEDQNFHSKLKRLKSFQVTDLEPAESYFIYRWRTGYGHLSGFGADPEAYRKFGEQSMNRVEPGDYLLTPVWEEDYTRLVKAYQVKQGLI